MRHKGEYYPRHIGPVIYDFYIRRMPELQAQFPEVFRKEFPTPLGIGIHKQLALETDFNSREISALLNVWTNRWEYIAMACSVRERINLDGSTVLINETHKEGFVEHFNKLHPNSITEFAKRFHKRFGRPAFLNVPMKVRDSHTILEEALWQNK